MKKFTLFLLAMMVSVLSSFAQGSAAPKFSAVATDGETVQYLYNVETHAFVCGANDWGTRASVDVEKGNQFKVKLNEDGTYRLNDLLPSGNWNAIDCDNNKDSWVDGAGRTGDGKWHITLVGENTYELTNEVAGDLKWGVDPSLINTRCVFATEGKATTWAFVNEADYNAYMEAAAEEIAAQKQAKLDAANRANLDARTAIANSTNIYGEGYDAWVAKTAELAALVEAGNYKETIVNPTAATGWHASTDYNFLLTPWTIGGEKANNFDKGLYINTWSVEGVDDGTNFLVPFFEYFVGGDKSLAATELATTVSGLTPGAEYNTSVWARVRIRDNGGDVAKGISFVAGGEPVDVCTGEGPALFRLIKVVANGVADAEGNLKIAFNIDADNNICWLSYKDVSYRAVANTIAAGKYAVSANVTLAQNVKEEFVPAEFKKYLGEYNTDATLSGDEKALTISENAEGGLFDGFVIVDDAVAYDPSLAIVLGGKKFNVRGLDGSESGKLAITATADGYTMEPAAIWYNGLQVAIVDGITIQASTPVSISAIASASESVKEIFSANGAKLSSMQKGLNIVRFSNGSVKKIMVK